MANPAVKRTLVSETIKSFTPQERDHIAEQLLQNLGPEFVSTRPGDGGRPAPYIEGHRVIQIANEIFGFDGWSSEILDRKTEVNNCENGKWSIAISCHLRITLKSGSFHEDCGFGVSMGARSLTQSFEKASKGAITDAMKRTLRQFGLALGGCLYDKEYIGTIRMIPPQKRVFDVDELRRPGLKKLKTKPAEQHLPEPTKNDKVGGALPKALEPEIEQLEVPTSDFSIPDSDEDLVWSDGDKISKANHDETSESLKIPAPSDIPLKTAENAPPKLPIKPLEEPQAGSRDFKTPDRIPSASFAESGKPAGAAVDAPAVATGGDMLSTPSRGNQGNVDAPAIFTPSVFVKGHQATVLQNGDATAAAKFDVTYRSPHMKVPQDSSKPLSKPRFTGASS